MDFGTIIEKIKTKKVIARRAHWHSTAFIFAKKTDLTQNINVEVINSFPNIVKNELLALGIKSVNFDSDLRYHIKGYIQSYTPFIDDIFANDWFIKEVKEEPSNNWKM